MEPIFLWVAVCWIVYRSLDPLNLEEIREMKEEHNGDSSRNLFPIRLEDVIVRMWPSNSRRGLYLIFHECSHGKLMA